MAQSPSNGSGPVVNPLELFLKAKEDERSVTQLEQPLQIHIVGTQAYIPSYTRSVMDKLFGAPVMAINTRTEPESKTIFIYPAKAPVSRTARKLRSTESMGAAYVAFGVPLRKIGVKLDQSRRVTLPLNVLEVPNEGIVFWASFAEMDKERRAISRPPVTGTKQQQAADS